MSENKTVIHPTAIVDPSVELGEGVYIGPYCVIGENVKIGDGCVLESHVTIKCNTELGKNNKLSPCVALGGDPQDYGYSGEPTFVKIGDNNILREFVTVHRASGEGKTTLVGSNSMIMAYSHVAHNCVIGDFVTIANYAGLCGHVHIEDKAVIGGLSGIHQNATVGTMAMIGGCARVNVDVPPYSKVGGSPLEVHGANVIAMRRHGVSPEARKEVKETIEEVFCMRKSRDAALAEIEAKGFGSPEYLHLVDFIKKMRAGDNGRQR
ncbi:MAG: acyl-ACP--UDP-N-acetylglucosamine O-acyltransferase [Abditibacteriota bacterium]|nr:acyl-ACP--UDP-N-acetylglucosamine O-acyltransferase [Abditibacteriota bacterium]